MTILDALIYGLIQGLSEFLPVSSSGHLALLPHVIKIQDPGVVFDLMMHLGTGLAVLIYFKNDIFRYVKTFTPSLVNLKSGSADEWYVRNFIFSTFVSVLMIVLFMPLSKMARDPWIIIFNLSFFGAVLWLADVMNRRKSDQLMHSPMEEKLQWKMATLIGLAQSVAIFPGVSRSGITLTAALILGMKRKDAAAFSFLLSLPIIFAGILKEIPDVMKGSQDTLIVLFAGIGTSFVVGWITIHFFMKLIGQIKLSYFTVYRWFLAGVMIWLLA